ncbi:hypothetical protein VKT23_004636 [Stygiomarasmius scandens]|uniref:Uncharacterized protein n=1 Tax=Marasmiellus scandens TaxID=2682957 RepID=A0ABR1JZ66_9AGAR
MYGQPKSIPVFAMTLPSTPNKPISLHDDLPPYPKGTLHHTSHAAVPRPPGSSIEVLATLDIALRKELRAFARIQIRKHFRLQFPLEQQDENDIQRVRAAIVKRFPELMQHMNLWSVSAALRDQLRSLKDTRNAQVRKQIKKKGRKLSPVRRPVLVPPGDCNS